MAEIPWNDDSRDVTDRQDGFEAIPAGSYPVVVVAAAVRPTKAQTGQLVEMQLEVVNGGHKGRRLFARFNVRNPNKTAEVIGRSELKQCAEACGFTEVPRDTESFVNKYLAVKVICRDYQGDTQNEVKSFMTAEAFKSQQAAKPVDESSPF